MFGYVLLESNTLVDSSPCSVELVIIFYARIKVFPIGVMYLERKVLTSLSGNSIGRFSKDVHILSSWSGANIIGLFNIECSVLVNFSSMSLVSKHTDAYL